MRKPKMVLEFVDDPIGTPNFKKGKYLYLAGVRIAGPHLWKREQSFDTPDSLFWKVDVNDVKQAIADYEERVNG